MTRDELQLDPNCKLKCLHWDTAPETQVSIEYVEHATDQDNCNIEIETEVGIDREMAIKIIEFLMTAFSLNEGDVV